jgi:hypothetical protein
MTGEWHGRGMGTAWARHAMCESAFRVLGADLSPPEAGASSSRVTCGIYDVNGFLWVARLSLGTVIQSTLGIIMTDTEVN